MINPRHRHNILNKRDFGSVQSYSFKLLGDNLCVSLCFYHGSDIFAIVSVLIPAKVAMGDGLTTARVKPAHGRLAVGDGGTVRY